MTLSKLIAAVLAPITSRRSRHIDARRFAVRSPGPEIADRGTVRLGGMCITAEFAPRRR